MGVTTTDMEFPLLQAVGLYVKETEGNGTLLKNLSLKNYKLLIQTPPSHRQLSF